MAGVQATHARADDDAHILRVLLGDGESRVVQRLPGGAHREMNEAIIAPHFFAVHVLCGVKVFHRRGELRIERRRIEAGDRLAARLPLTQSLPHRRGIVSDRADQPYACNDDTATHAAPLSSTVRLRSWRAH